MKTRATLQSWMQVTLRTGLRAGNHFRTADEELQMIRSILTVALLLTSATAISQGQPAQGSQVEPPQNVPPTALDREENNPAKAAAKVSEALKKEQPEASKDISVGTHADAVVVTGEAGSEAEAARAKATAEKAAEGARVATHIEVKEEAPTPAQIAQAQVVRDVESALKKDRRTAGLGVAVTADAEQVVHLNGLVPNRESRALIESIAAKAAPSKPVRNHLQIPGG